MTKDVKNTRNILGEKKDYHHHVKSSNSDNLKTCSIYEDLKLTYASTEEILQKPDVGKSFFQYRYLVVLLGLSVFCQMNFYRLATSISLVAMVNSSTTNSEPNYRSNITSCLLNSSSEEDFVGSKMKGEFNWDPATQGYILSAGFLGYVLTQIPAGMLSEVYGGKVTIVSGLLVSTIAHILSPLAAQHSSTLMIAVQLIRGAGQGFLMAAYPIIASNWIPSIERGLFNSIVLAGIALGAMAGGFSSGALCSSSILGGWPSVYYIYGAIGLVQCFCVQIFLYESPKVHPRITDKEKNYILHYQESVLNKKRPPTPWRDVSRSVPVYAMTYAMFGAYWASAHLLSVHPTFLTSMLHFSLEENGFIVSLTFLIQIFLTYSTSFVSHWLNRHNFVGVDKLRKGFNLLACLGYSMGLLGIIFAGCNRNLSNLLAIAGMSFSGFVFGGCIIVPFDMSPTFSGTLMGLTTTVASSGAFILPVIYGVLIQKEQSLEQWSKIYIISIAIVMSSGIIFCFFGSAEVQPWNYVPEDHKGNDRSKDTTQEIKTENNDPGIDAVHHL